MIDSDFTIGFKQGQEHGKQIILEKIEDIKTEIEAKKSVKLSVEGIWWNWALENALDIIEKHIGGTE